MTKKNHKNPRVIMQLCDQQGGYAGITQESQHLFSAFLDETTLQTTGLIVKDKAYCLRRGAKNTLARSKVKHLSDYIIHYQQDNMNNKIKPSLSDLCRLPFDILSINCRTTLGGLLSLNDFESKGLEHFLWDVFFSKTLNSSEFTKIVNASFRTLRCPHNLLHLAGLMAIAYPKLDTREYDIFLTQMPFPARVTKNTTLIVRYHDAIPILAPHLICHPKYHQSFHYNALKANAKKGFFACSSNASRNDLLHIKPELENRSIVIHDLVSEAYYPEEYSRHSLQDILLTRALKTEPYAGILPRDGSPSLPYLLMVSTIEPRKNHIRLIEAWEMLRLSMSTPLKLIIVGKLGWNYLPILEKIKPWQEQGEIAHLHQIQTSELRFLYQNAACVVCPSLMEGFDLTGIEAMLCGGKVAASKIPVHREIYGDAAIYFDPYSVEAQRNAIECIILPDQKDLATTLSARGLQWGKRYQRQVILPQWQHLFKTIHADQDHPSKDKNAKPYII
ncbi:MAG: glycosyltransferase family 1 protein [Legionellales bacterium]|nr:glycosyltransferase family 1 protein [Legionellales bacterium]